MRREQDIRYWKTKERECGMRKIVVVSGEAAQAERSGIGRKSSKQEMDDAQDEA